MGGGGWGRGVFIHQEEKPPVLDLASSFSDCVKQTFAAPPSASGAHQGAVQL